MATRTYPTEFTLDDLVKLRELVMKSHSVQPTTQTYNLRVKLTNLVYDARQTEGFVENLSLAS